MIHLNPTTCNICAGRVIYTSNAVIYGKEYGSGKCYLCTNCGAYVGTHRPRPKEALGLLADKAARQRKIQCHEVFDSMWQGKRNARIKRERLYRWLANQLSIPVSQCHFGYFDMDLLNRAYDALVQLKQQGLAYDSKGRIVNHCA